MEAIDEDAKAALDHVKDLYSAQGKRCLLLARRVVPGERVTHPQNTAGYEETMLEEAKSGLVAVGLVAIVDPLRPEIRDVMAALRGAGIRIAMVSNWAGGFISTVLYLRGV